MMTRRRHSLRVRVALAFAGLGALLSLLFAIGIWFAAHDVSRRLMDETLDAEMADYMSRRERNPNSLPPDTASLTGYLIRPGDRSAEIPAAVAGLGPGRHEIVVEGIPRRIEVAERDGERYILMFNEARQIRREQRLLIYLVSGVALMSLFAAIGGLWLARRVIAPVTELANTVSRADPQHPPRLARTTGAGTPEPGDEIDDLTRAFDHYIARIEALVERERAFTADASHELRTPLAVIRGAAEVLADDPALTAGQRQRVARIERAAQEMGELIAALLLLAREEEPSHDTACDAVEITRNCLARYREMAQARQCTLHLDVAGSLALPVPAAYFAIIVANLVHNAITHTARGDVFITLGNDRFVVSDTGSGIADRDMPRVFDRHFRGAESTGSGIGLALVKRICERLGWGITLKSEPVGGTTVTLGFRASPDN